MIARLRLLVPMTRPAVIALMASITVVGLTQAGETNDPTLLFKALVVVIAFLLFSVALNDLADEAIDRVNLPGDRDRPLVVGTATRPEMVAIGVTAGIVAVAASLLLHPPAVVVVIAGLSVSAGYSLRPVRLAERGAVASLVLPAAYVAVPYLVGIFSVRATLHADDLVLLAGLYVGFIGRILLKDFRDVRGDALFGKRTFLVRHGRRATCAFSALCWTVGVILLSAVRQADIFLFGAFGVFGVLVLGLLHALSAERGARRDETLISAIALVGRGTVMTTVAHLSMTNAAWSATAYRAVLASLVMITIGQVRTMLCRGPITRLTVPCDWETATPRTCSRALGSS